MEAAITGRYTFYEVKKERKIKRADMKKGSISQEDTEILDSLHKTARELYLAQRNFETAEDDLLIDSFSYEIMALRKRYDYYITLCKARGLVAEGITRRAYPPSRGE